MIKIIRTDNEIKIESSYSPDLPSRAKKLSGRWDANNRVWKYPIGAEPQVEKLYMDIYGEWDSMPLDTVNIVCKSNGDNRDAYACKSSLTLGGMIIATATGRDSGAYTAPKVIVLEGNFISAGSVKNWATSTGNDGVLFKVLNVPRTKAQALLREHESWCDEISIEETDAPIREKLIEERKTLLKRVEEIDKLLETK